MLFKVSSLISFGLMALAFACLFGLMAAVRGGAPIASVPASPVDELAFLALAIATRSDSNRIDPDAGPDGVKPDPGEWLPCESLAGIGVAGTPAYGWPLSDGAGEVTAAYCDPAYQDTFGEQHWGLDIAAEEGAGVIATMDGMVERAGLDESYGMGYNVKLCNGDGWCAIYLHLLEWPPLVVGESVSAGQEIGKVGQSGEATGPHLHYQINMPGGLPVDPWPTVGR